MKGLLTSLTVVLAAPFGFVATAYAAGEASPDGGSLLDLAKPVYEAVMAGQGWLAAALALVFAVALARRYAPWDWFRGDAGGVVLALVGSFGGATATALAAGQAMSGGLIAMAAGVALAAMGGYAGLKKLIAPALEWLKSRLPSWAHPAVDLLLWVVTRPSAIANAEKKGAEAVKKNPGKGAAGIIGEATELE